MPNFYIYDVVKNLRGSQIQSGAVLALPQLPAKWTIEIDFGLAPGHTAEMSSSIDGGPVYQAWQAPYCVNNRGAILLTSGSHTISYGEYPNQAQSTFNFSIGIAPATSQFGANLPYACNDSRLDISKYPGLLNAAKAMQVTRVRSWLEYPNLVKLGSSYWSILKEWKAAGFKIGIQYQGFQDQKPKYAMPPKATYMDALNRMIDSGIVDEIYWANEIDSTSGQVYFIGSLAQMAQMLADVAPVASAAGITNIAPSFVHGNNYDQKLNAAGIYTHMDGIDQHFYGGESANQANMAKWAATSASYGKKCYSTEFGFGGSGQGHATSQLTALTALRPLGGIYIPWTFIPDSSGYQSPLDIHANPSNPEYSAWVTGMTG